jgi:two-component system, cell cycle response regulator
MGAAKLAILVVDDETENLEFIQRALRRDYDVVTASSGEEALRVAHTRPFAVIISDHRMPGMTGVQFLREAKEVAPAAVRVILTGYASTEAAIEAINLSKVSAFLQKPIQAAALSAAVTTAVEIFRLQRQNAELIIALEERNRALDEKQRMLALSLDEKTKLLFDANARLQELVVRDPLTGVYNHRYFQERSEQELSRAKRYERTVGFVFCDIDHFKAYNDANGHQAGDEALKDVASLLSRIARRSDILTRVRETDIVARWGGEEFVILLPETDTSGGLVLAERLRKAVEQHSFAGEAAIPGGKLTMSFGVASYPRDGDDRRAVIGQADAALYAAKNAGRNRVRAADGSQPG